MRYLLVLFFVLLGSRGIYAQPVNYPHPVRYITLTLEEQPARMAYMDVQPQQANGATVLLLHGKNFNGFYWKDVIALLTAQGYRVVVPDQVGWGKSDAPNIHYSFHLLTNNTKNLLDTLGIDKVHVLGHSMGGMLAARFVLLFPQRTGKLILENPIGLEDYKTFVPYRTLEEVYQGELKATYESYKNYQKSYYPEWKPEYEQYVAAQAAVLQAPDFSGRAWANALTYQMIYEQPVVYELPRIQQSCLLIIGQEDRTVVGKNLLPGDVAAQHGLYPQLGRKVSEWIKGSRLVELKGVGHIPHIQVPQLFGRAVLEFLSAK